VCHSLLWWCRTRMQHGSTIKNPARYVLLALLAVALAAGVFCQDSAHSGGFRGLPVRSTLTDPAIESKVDALLKQMTLEEKVGQLVQYSVGTPAGPGTSREDYDGLVAKGEVGSLYNLNGAAAANHYQHIAMEKARLHIPLINGLDVIHGYRTEFPVPLGLSATWDPDLVQKAARIAAVEASAAGVNWTFSPMVDIARDPRWGRMIEGAGEDPYLGSIMAAAYVRGYQGSNLKSRDSIAACAKHFVGYGAAEGGRDYNTTEISNHTLHEVYLPPFYTALDAGAPTIMSAFTVLNGVPEAANPFTLTDILRDEWHFPGIADSDFGAVRELMAHGIANDGEMAAYRAFSGGLDMDMEGNIYHQYLAQLVKSGKISESRLDESVRRVLRVKFALGLFEHPYTDESREKSEVGPLPQQNLDLARTAAEQSFVLLRNESINSRHVLPLTSQQQTVALIGPLADNAGEMLGSWGGHGQASDVVTLKVALTRRLGADHVKYAKGAEFRTASDEQINAAVEAARSADVAILTLGEEASTMTAEAASRAHLDLPGRQEELLEKVCATGKPVVLLLFGGRPLTLPWAFAHVPAVIEAWYPGLQAGPALVRILYGEAVPSGRLTVSWPRSVGQIPIYYDALSTGRPAGNVDLTKPPTTAEEKYVSRYIDELNAPQFPFGYGLSYAEFGFSGPTASSSKLSAHELSEDLRSRPSNTKTVLTVSANVTNAGKVAADEVVQVYVGLRGTSTAQPVRALKAFQRVSLAPGETKKVSFPLTPESFALWDIHNNYTVEPCEASIWVSPNSASDSPVIVEIAP
jgi:beta-glucosidase